MNSGPPANAAAQSAGSSAESSSDRLQEVLLPLPAWLRMRLLPPTSPHGNIEMLLGTLNPCLLKSTRKIDCLPIFPWRTPARCEARTWEGAAGHPGYGPSNLHSNRSGQMPVTSDI